MPRISKRLEALERAADEEAFAKAFPFAVAYYLGGAKDPSEVMHAYAQALGYQDLDKFFDAFADLSLDRSGNVTGISDFRERAFRAQCKLFTKFGYDLCRASPAGLADAAYRIVSTLPEEWRATIKSVHWEAEASRKELMQLAEEMELAE